jgi:hypothetical protein
MNKNKLKTILFPVILLAMFVTGSMALASEVTGVLRNGEVIVIVAPTASPAAGTYTSTQSVSLSAAGSQSIRYTTDGSTTPNCASGGPGFTYQSQAPIPVSESLTIKAVSCYPNNNSSDVITFVYVINLPASTPTPTPAPAAGGGGGGGGGGFVPTPTPSPSSLSEEAKKVDINNDNKIDILDFNVIMVNWGAEGNNVADLNKDGKVDILDFNALMVFWS